MGGNDRLVAGSSTSQMYGGDGDDIVDGRGNSFVSIIDGGNGNDTLYSNPNSFLTARGGAGDDTIFSSGSISGGAGNDKIYIQSTYNFFGGARIWRCGR